MKGILESIGNRLNKTRETNWSMIFSAIGVAFLFYAAAIRPLGNDLEREVRNAADLAKAVLVQNDKISDLKNDIVELKGLINLIESFEEQKIEHDKSSKSSENR